ncbi:BON domain-containing protein [Flagellimonas allohymeniacidonis]|uniref:BON domain-containing protein n=1 Tax=Flagellimonas allohymeniacidonis TaxID=2517819 RepID=A0A4Q8QDE5_9FLAO|nr:BON domain-containing protein [Allomuricauda hymeniacidonis]TAI48415.1 BON domain-containing protein [Allomuricauda hymeniacidonis]
MKANEEIPKTDAEIKNDVLEELEWLPDIDETEIGVIVEDGTVTLMGVVDSYIKKVAAVKAIKGIAGVRAVAENIDIKYGNAYKKTDKEIAKAAANALEWNSSIPAGKIDITVENGWVYLTGEVKWKHQKHAAKKAVENLLGVKGVNTNSLIIEKTVQPSEVTDQIVKAFERSADIEAKGIRILVDGHTVQLKGRVHSIKEKEEAEKAAYKAPGVREVKNDITVQFYPVYS